MRRLILQSAIVKSPSSTSDRAAKSLFPVRPRYSWPVTPGVSMLKVLLIDEDGDHAEQFGRELAQRRLAVIRAADCGEAIARLRNREHICDIVILSMTGRSRA